MGGVSRKSEKHVLRGEIACGREIITLEFRMRNYKTKRIASAYGDIRARTMGCIGGHTLKIFPVRRPFFDKEQRC